MHLVISRHPNIQTPMQMLPHSRPSFTLPQQLLHLPLQPLHLHLPHPLHNLIPNTPLQPLTTHPNQPIHRHHPTRHILHKTIHPRRTFTPQNHLLINLYHRQRNSKHVPTALHEVHIPHTEKSFRGKTVREDGEEPVEGDGFEIDAQTREVGVDAGTEVTD